MSGELILCWAIVIGAGVVVGFRVVREFKAGLNEDKIKAARPHVPVCGACGFQGEMRIETHGLFPENRVAICPSCGVKVS